MCGRRFPIDCGGGALNGERCSSRAGNEIVSSGCGTCDSPADSVRRRCIALIGVLIFVRLLCRANPPEYLAATHEPADTAAQIPSPFEEPTVELPAWRLFRLSTEPFLRDLAFSLQPRLFYDYVDNGKTLSEAFAAGGALILTTGWWHDFLQLGIAGYTSQPLATPYNAGGTGLLRPDGDGLLVLGQAWAKLREGPVMVTLFRQDLEWPFVNGDDSKMIPNLFEAYRLDVRPSNDLRFGLTYITDMKSRNSDEFLPMSEVAGVPGVNRGTSVAGFLAGSVTQTYLGAINLLTWDLLNIMYMQAGRTWKLSEDFQLRGDVQFIDERSVGDDLLGHFNTQLYGASLNASYRSAVLTLAVTKTYDGSDILSPFGGVPAFNSVMISDFDSAGETSYRVGASYDFARIGLTGVKAFANYVHGELPEGHSDDEVDATVDYYVHKGPLKNCSLSVRYGYNSPSYKPASEDFRVIANYTFTW
jgi:hypothetical protein